MLVRARRMRRRALVTAPVAAVAALAGCGTTEKSGSIGDELTAKGIQVTVQRVSTKVPVPTDDFTGLSSPAAGKALTGVLAKVCSDHGGAIGPYDFGLDSSGGSGDLKFPEHNLSPAFDTVRTGCGTGWVVFEIPKDADPTKVTFGFQDTGSAQASDNNQVDAKFSWDVSG